MVATAYVLSVIPGFAIMARGAMAPPGQETLFGTIVTVVSTLTMLLATLYRREAARLARRRVVAVCSALISVAVLTLAGFALVRSLTVIPYTLTVLPSATTGVEKASVQRDTVLIPLLLPPELEALRERAGGRASMVDEDPEAVRAMARDEHVRMAATFVLLVLLYAATNAATVLALGLAGWRVAASSGALRPLPAR